MNNPAGPGCCGVDSVPEPFDVGDIGFAKFAACGGWLEPTDSLESRTGLWLAEGCWEAVRAFLGELPLEPPRCFLGPEPTPDTWMALVAASHPKKV